MPHAEEPSEDLHIVDLHEARKGNANSSFKSLDVHFRATAWLGHPVKMAARALSRRSAEDPQKSLAHAITRYLRNLPVKHLRRMEFPGGRHRRSHKKTKHCWMFEACASAPGCLTALLSSLTEQFIPTFIRTFCRKTINASNEAHLRMDVATGHWPKDVKQQQKCFNKRKYAFWSGPEPRPRDAVARRLEHETQQSWENEWSQTVL